MRHDRRTNGRRNPEIRLTAVLKGAAQSNDLIANNWIILSFPRRDHFQPFSDASFT